MTSFVLYSKPGCHLCEDLEAKLRQIPEVCAGLEVRDIRSRDDWHEQYLFTIPVLCWVEADIEHPLPLFPPRVSVDEVKQRILDYMRSPDP